MNAVTQRSELAIERLKAELKQKPDDCETLYSLARAHFARSEQFQATEYLFRLRGLVPDWAEIHFLLGQCNEQMGYYLDARDNYSQAIRLDPKPAGPHKGLSALSINPANEWPLAKLTAAGIDVRFYYLDFEENEASCRVRIWTRDGAETVVLLTQDELTSGTSITNLAERLWQQVMLEYGLEPANVIALEHYERSFGGSQNLDRVFLQHRQDASSMQVQWESMEFEEFERLTGFRLHWELDQLPA